MKKYIALASLLTAACVASAACSSPTAPTFVPPDYPQTKLTQPAVDACEMKFTVLDASVVRGYLKVLLEENLFFVRHR